MPGFTYENAGHYGWHGFRDGSEDDDHAAKARGALQRTRALLDNAENADLSTSFSPDGPAEEGVHMLILDEILYAANRGLVEPDDVVDFVETKPANLELVLTGGHEEPTFVTDHADLVTNVKKQKHPFDSGHSARKGTEY
jgi:cob(I)alamin adenosyltransferase